MNGRVENQHYIPQFYLNRFSTNRKISVYFIHSNKLLQNQDARNFAAKKYYYAVQKSELESLLKEVISIRPELRQQINFNNPQFIEDMLARSEDVAKRVLDAIENDPALLTDHETQAKLVIFLHDLAFRVDKYRTQIEQLNTMTVKAFAGENVPDSYKRKIRTYFDPAQARMQQLNAITGIHSVLQTATKLFEEYEWYFATSKGDMCFVISDDPAGGIRHNPVEICFPLSSKNAVIFRKIDATSPLMSDDVSQGNRISVSKRNVFRFNILQRCCALEYMFGDTRSLQLLASICKQLRTS